MLKGQFPIERFDDMKTPFYFYDIALLRRTLDAVAVQMERNPVFRVHYAVKANFNPGILREIAARGLGADCVSGGEIKAAIRSGFQPEGIVFAGVGKSDEDIIFALQQGIARFNVESSAELEVISDIAASMGKVAPVAIRVNPNIGAHTHANISTGRAEDKFGIDKSRLTDVVALACSLPGVEWKGLHFHIGSQILDMSDFQALCNRINEVQDNLEQGGFRSEDINVGGGLGIEYEHPNHLQMADFQSYFNVFRSHLRLRAGQTCHFELGRSIVAPCGSLICRVLYVKDGVSRRFAIIDGSMTELIRPALYHAYHRIENLSSEGDVQKYDVVGPVCESSDVFGRDVQLDQCRRGDYIAIRSAGAYGESMSSNYNCRSLPQSLLNF